MGRIFVKSPMSKIRRREDPLNFFSRQVVSFDNPPIYLGAIMAGYEIKHSNSIRTKEGGGGGFQESRARPLHLPNTITNVIEKLNMVIWNITKLQTSEGKVVFS